MQAGWPVIPLKPGTKARRTTKERPNRPWTLPSTDPAQIRRWWWQWPTTEVGVVLRDRHVVVLDLDGPTGWASLAHLLDLADLPGLPETFTVTTGRADGGKHLWFRLPAGAPKLVGQYGSHYPATPGLDVLFNGLVVAPGSFHKSDRMYVGNRPIPRIEELAELPGEMYGVLRRRGKLKDDSADSPDSSRRRGPAASGETQRSERSRASEGFTKSEESEGRAVPRSVQWMLHDTSDGRRLRTLKVCTQLVWAGFSDGQITEVVLGSPLGDKARERGLRWLQQTIDQGREFERDKKPVDKDGYFASVLRSVESTSKVRILHSLLLRAGPTGVVTRSLTEIGIDSATNSMSSVKELIEAGWLEVVTPGSRGVRTTYRLTQPDDLRQGEPTESTTPLPYPIRLVGSPWCRSFGPDHDAFRSAKGSANAAYAVLCALSGELQTEDQLAERLPLTLRTLQARLKMLSTAGLAVRTEEGWTLTPEPVGPLLDVVAEQCGTAGKRNAAVEAYRVKCAEWDEQRYQAGVPGSDIWLMIRRKRAMTEIENGHYVRVLQDTGITPDQLAEHLAWAEYDLMQRAEGITVQESPVRRLQGVPDVPNVLDRMLSPQGRFTNVPQVNVLHLSVVNLLQYPTVNLWPTPTGHLAKSA